PPRSPAPASPPPAANEPPVEPDAAPVTTTLAVPAGEGVPSVPMTLVTTPPGKPQPVAHTSGKPSASVAEAPRRPFAPLAPLEPFLPLMHLPAPPARPAPLPQPASRGPAIPVARREEPVERVPIRERSTPAPAATAALPEEVVLRAMASAQPQLQRCWDKAQLSDQVPGSNKVSLHLELDAAGKITTARATTDSPRLAACLVVRARQLAFPAPGKPAVVDLPLMFR
ncbi:MAG TPA: hypothetical protein VFP84_14520, partial [Kofleriaceae bacterium]|nr:hypothetical protein [Kofleriaceae bacterium]